MPDPQNAPQTPPPDPSGIDLSSLRTRTIQQAQAELPQPKITPPWEEEPELNLPPTTKLGQAYEKAKSWLGEHEQHLSERVLAPFRTGLDRMAEDLQTAAEKGRTQSGGALGPTTRALAAGTSAMLRMVPVGKDIKETALMSVVPPELGPEGKALSREIKAGERVAEKAAPNLEGLRVRKIEPAEGPQFPKYTKEQMLAEGADGHLDTAIKAHIPLDVIEGHEPTPAMEGGYKKGTPITQPIEVSRNPESGKFTLYAGNHRVQQAKVNGQTSIPAFVEGATAQDLKNFSAGPTTAAKPSTKAAPDLEGIRSREVSPATKSKVVSPAKEVPKPTQHEAVGIHSDDLPYRAKYQDVDFSAQDLQDSAKKVTPETIRKDYAAGDKTVSVYQAHIPMEDLPSAKFVEPEEEEFDRGEHSRPRVGVPIKVTVNKDGSMEILDGNHRVQTWEEQGQKYAPAWVIDRRGPGIEKLSEDELAERAEQEAERNKPVTQFDKIDLTKNIPNDEAVKTEIPLSKLSVSNKAYSGAESNIAQGRGSKTEGPIQVFYDSDKKQFLVADGMHRVVDAHQKGAESVPAQLWSGYSDYYASVRPEDLKDLITPRSATKQASILTPEGAQPLAEKLGAKVVGSIATGKTSPDPYGINRGPKDLDLRIDGKYKSDEVLSKLKAEGFEPRGSSLVSSEEAKKSGKDYGGPGWKRIEHFENAAGHKVDVFHDEAGQPWEKSGKDFDAVYHGGKVKISEVDPSKLQQRDAGFFGKGFYVTKNEKFAKTYGKTVSEKSFNPDARILDVDTIHPQHEHKINPELQKEIEATQRKYYEGLPKAQKDPGLVDRYMELVDPKNKAFDLGTWVESVNRYAEQNGYDAIRFSDGEIVVKNPKAIQAVVSKAEPKKPLHERLFDEALKTAEKPSGKPAAQTVLNASGESAASQEAINRASSEKAAGTKRFRVDTRSGKEFPLFGPDAVDVKPGPYDKIIMRGPKGETVIDSGPRVR